jgi:hypothetical protein
MLELAGDGLRNRGISKTIQRAREAFAAHDPKHVKTTQSIEGNQPVGRRDGSSGHNWSWITVVVGRGAG